LPISKNQKETTNFQELMYPTTKSELHTDTRTKKIEQHQNRYAT